MQHFRAVVSQFGGLAIGDLAQHARFGHKTRIGRHDAVDIGPDPQFGGVERCRQNRRREIRSAAAESGGPPVGGRAIESGDHGKYALHQQRAQALARLLPGGFHDRRSVAVDGVGDDGVGGVERHCPHAFRFEERRDQQRGEPLADRDGLIDRARRALAQQEHPPGDARKLGDDGAQAFDRGFLAIGGQQLAASLGVPLLQNPDVGVEPRRVACLGVAHRVEQQVGDPGHRRDHHQRRTLPFLLRADPRRHAHSLGRPHTGSAEFHH